MSSSFNYSICPLKIIHIERGQQYMMNNSQDKGYLTIELEETADGLYLREMSILERPNVFSFYVDYEDGTIFIDWNDGEPRKVIGYYGNTPDQFGRVNVYNENKTQLIGRVGNELIDFVKRDADPSLNRYFPESECLAWYSVSGRITYANRGLAGVGIINGSEFGGAAAFVAIFYSYIFKSIFRDYFEMDTDLFKDKYASYLNPF